MTADPRIRKAFVSFGRPSALHAQINFGLIFAFGLLMVFFTLENTEATTVHLLPGLQHTMPLAGLLLLVAGIGAVSAWFFAAWTGMLNNVDQISKASEFEAQQVRIQELESDLSRYRSCGDPVGASSCHTVGSSTRVILPKASRIPDADWHSGVVIDSFQPVRDIPCNRRERAG